MLEDLHNNLSTNNRPYIKYDMKVISMNRNRIQQFGMCY